ncbi:hypothetical protein DEDE109153_13295 [Deinococcus deserti]|uniref:Uncharacterized protein n=1 Tax=Deinococcus deserti (strain DSM 17065 / CIP 109153 / LMG 22923 / VCD115) TaxID=546414 RepID=C1CZ19_DEIDV|nr:hypothetical protein [Deinococcus deserti]ACO45057.1 Hypothetical protein Deide_02480 [Deinococcus deserti VCD115]
MNEQLLTKAAEGIGTLNCKNDLLRLEVEAALERVFKLERTLVVLVAEKLPAATRLWAA